MDFGTEASLIFGIWPYIVGGGIFLFVWLQKRQQRCVSGTGNTALSSGSSLPGAPVIETFSPSPTPKETMEHAGVFVGLVAAFFGMAPLLLFLFIFLLWLIKNVTVVMILMLAVMYAVLFFFGKKIAAVIHKI